MDERVGLGLCRVPVSLWSRDGSLLKPLAQGLAARPFWKAELSRGTCGFQYLRAKMTGQREVKMNKCKRTRLADFAYGWS